MKTIDEYNNILELLKKALEFYAKDDTYTQKTQENPKMVELDRGSQARFALEKLNEFLDEGKSNEKEFVNNIRKAIEANEDYDTMMGLINAYKIMVKTFNEY